MGNTPCAAALGQRGILRLRGTLARGASGEPAMPMTHPAYLLRTPAAKREAWADLLGIKARLTGIAMSPASTRPGRSSRSASRS